MYVHGLDQSSQVEPTDKITWLDYLILSNPQGVMKVLAANGYTGYLAPQDQDEMIEACLDFMDNEGDQAVIDLLQEHPLYKVIFGICTSQPGAASTYKNADGSTVLTTLKGINYKLLAENILVVIGAFYLAVKLWAVMAKKD
jgi:hypothetical protein